MPPSTNPFAYLRYRQFWAARILAALGQTCLVLSIGWSVYEISRETMGIKESAFWLGMIGLVQFAPVLALAPVAGVIIDSFARATVARLAMAAIVIGAGALIAASALGHLSLPTLFVIAFLVGCAKSFLFPTLNAITPSLVPLPALPRAVATTAVASRIGNTVGPVVGGLAYAVSPAAAFGLSAALMALAVACLALVGPGERPVRAADARPIRMMVEGLRYVAANRLLLGMLSLDLVAVLLGGATALLPVYARDILHVGASGLGYLRAAPALGALLTAGWFSWKVPGAAMGRKMLVAVGVFGVATIGFGFSRSFTLSLLSLGVLGAADMVSVVTRQTLLQLHTPDAMRGRVNALSTLSVSISNELGEAESGFLAALVGPVAAVVAGGVGTIASAAIWSRLFPELLSRSDPPAD